MRKRLLALCMAVTLCITGVIALDVTAKAEEIEQDATLSDIMTEDALIGYAPLMTRGVYLAKGISVINDAGLGRIGWGGSTDAAKKCTVSVNSIVERKVNGSWVRVTSSSATNTSAYSASVSKYLLVGSGYYYRVRSTHTAGSDGSSSYTSGLWM